MPAEVPAEPFSFPPLMLSVRALRDVVVFDLIITGSPEAIPCALRAKDAEEFVKDIKAAIAKANEFSAMQCGEGKN